MKKTMWFPLVATVLYAVMQAVSKVTQMQETETFRWYLMVLTVGRAWLPPACVAAYILCGEKFDKRKDVLFIVATALLALSNFMTLLTTARTLTVIPESYAVWMMVPFNLITFAATVLMVIGTLQGFRRVSLLQGGAFVSAAITVLYVGVALLIAGGASYFENVPDGVSAVNWIALCSIVATALFYAGIGVFAVEKKREKSLDFCA